MDTYNTALKEGRIKPTLGAIEILGENGDLLDVKLVPTGQQVRVLYTLAKLMGDYNAVKKGKVGQRVGRRAAGKATGKAMRKLFK